MSNQEVLRNLPKVDVLVQDVTQNANGEFSVYQITEACRIVIDELRASILTKQSTTLPPLDQIQNTVFDKLKLLNQYSLRPVVNATGVVIHTNLGRAVLPESVADNIKRVATSYSTLEYDLCSGQRGSRHSHIESLICRLTGAESAMAVNNNAAAIMLALSATCAGKEVVVSRGELVEIGGSFRVPDIMEMSSCKLREVGTTNKTKPLDYQRAINENTAALLKVHTSNFKVVGFTESVDIPNLSSIAKTRGIPLIHDLGSGLMVEDSSFDWLKEGTARDSINNGADIVCFSGDKLFGGTQAGIIAGQKKYIDAMKAHQLARVVRLDKLSLAALEGTLRLYLDKSRAIEQIPVLSMLSRGQVELKRRAQLLCRRLKGANVHLSIQHCQSVVGGGSAPGEMLDSVVISITSSQKSAQAIEKEFRNFETPIITRIKDGAVLLDMRTIEKKDYDIIASAFGQIFVGEKQ